MNSPCDGDAAREDSVERIKQKIRTKQPFNPVLEGWKSYAQTDEDGIIRHCLKKISAKSELSNTFLEIGCGNGKENNTHQLLLDGCRGIWVDGSEDNIQSIASELGGSIFENLLIINKYVREGDELLAVRAKNYLCTTSLDFLSIDIDGNDELIASPFITSLNPKLVCVEYNAKFRPPTKIRIRSNPNHRWTGDDYYGSSLQSWCDYFSDKNYKLICCNFSGVNAFFARQDLLDCFDEIYPSCELYMPPRYWAALGEAGHRSSLKWLNQILNDKQFADFSRPIDLIETSTGPFYAFRNDFLGDELRKNGHYHEKSVRHICEFLKLNYNFTAKTLINVGANIGLYSIYGLKADLFENCICIEPQKENFKLLEKNLVINNVRGNALTLQCAASDRAGSAQIEICASNCGDHRIRSHSLDPKIKQVDQEATRDLEIISTITLDSLIENPETSLTPADCLAWIDTQGHEGHILLGAKKLIRKNSCRFIVIEYWPYGLLRSGLDKARFLELIKNFDCIYEFTDSEGDFYLKKANLQGLADYFDASIDATAPGIHPHKNLLLIA